MFKVRNLPILAVFSLVLISAAAQAYEPPIGIPNPSSRWGVINPMDDPVPARPSSWTSEQPGYYYVDPDTGSDIGNTYGYPGKPRATIPDGSKVVPGAYIELTGTFENDAGINGLNCTEAQPCWLVGSATAPPDFKSKFRITNNSYLLIDNIECGNGIGDCVVISKSGHHIILRNSYIHDRIHGGGGNAGIGIGSPDDGKKMHDIISYNNTILDLGDLSVEEDQDFHAHTVNTWGREYRLGTELFHVYILDNNIARASGDGVQINGGLKEDAMLAVHNIYVGRNTCEANRQTCVGVKQSTNVIVSQNTAKHFNPENYNTGGSCFAHQYPKDNLWFIFNTCYDASIGLRHSTMQPLKDAAGNEIDRDTYHWRVYAIGNLFVDIKRSQSDPIAIDSRFRGRKTGQGIGWTNSDATSAYHIDNTIHNAWQCLGGEKELSELQLHGNICSEIRNDALNQDMQLTCGQVGYLTARDKIYIDFNYFIDPQENRYACALPDFNNDMQTTLDGFKALSPAVCANCAEEVNSPSSIFVNPTNSPDSWDFSLVTGSGPTGANTKHWAYQTFRDLYGIDIYVDHEGNPRDPLTPNMGAFETPGSSIVKATKPLPPEHFEVIKIIQN